MKTEDLFGVPPEVAQKMKETMTHTEYLKVGVVLMERLQVQSIDEYDSDEFKYRSKAISNYDKWIKE